MSLYDHLFALLLVVLWPALAMWDFRRLKSALARGDENARVRGYSRVFAEQWGTLGLLVAMWIGLTRPFAQLGLELGEAPAWRVNSSRPGQETSSKPER